MTGTPGPAPREPRCSSVMARLSLSAVERLVAKPGGWREPVVHRALLVSGLSVLLTSITLVQNHQKN